MLVKLYFSLHFIPLNPDPRTKMNADPTGSEFGFTSLLKSNCTAVFMPAQGRGGWPARRRGSYAPVSSAASRSWSQFHDFPAKKTVKLDDNYLIFHGRVGIIHYIQFKTMFVSKSRTNKFHCFKTKYKEKIRMWKFIFSWAGSGSEENKFGSSSGSNLSFIWI